jgi:anhydro-N-acetylmuramic acid kinase
MKKYAVGLMSGTSADGVDAALIETDGRDDIHFLGALTQPYPKDFQRRLIEGARSDLPLLDLLQLEKELTAIHGHAVADLCKRLEFPLHKVDVIGFHGHTIRHVPKQGITFQIGNISQLAEQIGRPVVGDFRRRDLAAHGEGAPLVPLYHAALLADGAPPLAILNIGGVANVTYLGPQGMLVAGDVGPGCGLMDGLCQERLGAPFDVDGQLAASGTPDQSILMQALQADFFRRPLPKSADRFEFSAMELGHLETQDALATLALFTATAAAEVIQGFEPAPREIIVVGGGSHNKALVELLSQRLANRLTLGSARLRPDSLEAECFAWLAVRRLLGLPTSAPSTTGCAHETCGGLLSA